LIKKLRKKTKPKIKAFVYIPLFYTLIGFIWFFFCYAVNVYNGDDQSNYDRETLIQKDFVKQFFLVNPNLLNISVIIEEIETINQKLGKNTEEISIGKLQTNYMIRFSIIFIFQMLIIYLVETKIYPYFKPESHKYRRTKIVYEKLELDNPNMNSN
jgi:predicted permease